MTKRSKVLAIVFGVAIVGDEVAKRVYGDESILHRSLGYAALAVWILWISMMSWRLKRRVKERMKRGLGRLTTTN